jgi:predicted RecA/RadA family phage recombinase
MKNFVQEGLSLDFVAPAGGVVGGAPELRGSILHIPAKNAAEGESYAGWVEGVYELPCATGTAWDMTVTVLYWDATNERVTNTATNNTKIGFAAAPKVASAPTGNVRILPII